MAADVVYQVAQVGLGFEGKGQAWLGAAMQLLKLKLRRIDGPYTLVVDGGEPSHPRPRSDTLNRVKDLMTVGPVGIKAVIRGDSYDQPRFAIRKVKAVPDESPIITAAKKFLGGTRYVFGAIPSLPLPTGGDCSGLTLRAVDMATDKTLPHSANLQMGDRRLRKFTDPQDLQSGDFIFYNFGRLPYPQADDVTLFVENGKQIGSRPSRNGVTIFDMLPERQYVLKYGRLS